MIPTTDLHHFLRTRRSIRRFEPQPVDETVLQRVLTSAGYAPSAHNRQPWRFAVVSSETSRERLADAMAVDFRRDLTRDGLASEEIERQVARSRARLLTAPAVVVLCMDASEMDGYPDALRRQAELTMAVQSVAAAGLQLQLAVHAEGLGSVWVCSPLFAQSAVRHALDLPDGWQPQGMIYIGRAAERPEPRTRKPLDDLTVRR